jgi:hypothetical protein
VEPGRVPGRRDRLDGDDHDGDDQHHDGDDIQPDDDDADDERPGGRDRWAAAPRIKGVG